MKMLSFFVLLLAFGTVHGQRVADHYSWQKRAVVQPALVNAYPVKIDGVVATHAGWLALADSNILSIQVYRPKEAKKLFGKQEGANGMVKVKTFYATPSPLTVDSTADSAKFVVLQNFDTVFLKTTKEAVLSAEDKNMHESWQRFLRKNLNSSVPADNGAPAGIYIVRVSFIIQADGKLVSVHVHKDPGFGTGDEVKRVLNQSALWQPAQYNGRAVKAGFRQVITFIVEED